LKKFKLHSMHGKGQEFLKFFVPLQVLEKLNSGRKIKIEERFKIEERLL